MTPRMRLAALASVLALLSFPVFAQPSPEVQAAIAASIETQANAQANGSSIDWTTRVSIHALIFPMVILTLCISSVW